MGRTAESGIDILCIGAVLWDVIGRAAGRMRPGADVPGRIVRQPGGVALNIAMALRRFGMRPALLGAIGRDAAGDALRALCAQRGVDTRHLLRPPGLPTDIYMALEDEGGLVGAIADARSLESVGEAILRPLRDGTLGDARAPYAGIVALDGNLSEALLAGIAADPCFARAELRLAPASPGKAERLRPLLSHPGVTLYANREEAGILCRRRFTGAREAALALLETGVRRALVTDGGAPVADAGAEGVIVAPARKVPLARVTGAGDTFMAAHIAAETGGAGRAGALDAALRAAAEHVSGEAEP